MSEPNPSFWKICSICIDRGVQSSFCNFYTKESYDEHMKEHENEFKIGDRVWCKSREYAVFCGLDPSKSGYKIWPEIDKSRTGTVKGFQNPEYDGRDVVLRWDDFFWDTTMPSEFLMKVNG